MSDKSKTEAVLFSVGNRISLEEIAKLCNLDEKKALQLLRDLQADYHNHDGALMIIEEGAYWKISVREPYLPLVQSIVAETELSKTVMETLAVIAWKAPILQSDVIRVRTNKAYDHISELEEAGFITRSRHGRTRLIKLTDKFFQYFDLSSKDDVKDKFKDFTDVKKAERIDHEIKGDEMLGDLEIVEDSPKVKVVQGEEDDDVEVVDLPDVEKDDTAS